MIVLGLTGSIGMGKSTTAAMFQDLGIPIYDADAEVHKLYAAGGDAVGPVGEAFPGVVINGAIDRNALGARVLGNEAAIRQLEAIVHPLVNQSRIEFFRKAAADQAEIVVLDIPLLFETGGEERVDAIVVVSAPPEIQKQRVLERPGMTEAKFNSIFERQTADHHKRQRAHYIIETGNGLEEARKQVRSLIDLLRERGLEAIKTKDSAS